MFPVFLALAMLLGFISFVAGIAWLFLKLSIGKQIGDSWLTAQFNTRELEGIPLDGDVRVFGSLHTSDQLLSSPITQTACIWYEVEITEYCQWQEESTNEQGDTVVETKEDSRVVYRDLSSKPLLLKDHLGVVWFMPDGVDMPGEGTYKDRQEGRYEGAVSQGIDLAQQVESTDGGWKQILQTGVDIVGAANSWSRSDARHWYITTESVVQEATQVMTLAQVGQDQNGQRFLHDTPRGRRSFAERAQSADDYQQKLEQKAKTLSKAKRFFVVCLALTALCAGIGVVLDVPQLKKNATQTQPLNQSP